jgi:[ribosomal protein S5]-alanine N-acetyltransferase
MAFFRSVTTDRPPAIEGEGVTLRVPVLADYAEWAHLRELSREFLTPWEPVWPVDDLTRGAFRRRIQRYVEDQNNDLSYSFFVFRKEDDVMVGGLTIANIRRGVAQAGSLGYWMGEPFVRRGHMTDAVRAVAPFAFGALALHRLEAACILSNTASSRLLAKCGFVREGMAREYLCINGKWQDHLLFARLRDDPVRSN